MKEIKYRFLVLIILFQSSNSAQFNDTLAIVGKHIISSEAFLERFELLPSKDKDNRGKQEIVKEQFLASMISEKLLSFGAYSIGFNNDEIFKRKRIELERLFVRDELFKRKVQSQIKINSTELNDGIKKYQKDLVVFVLQFKLKSNLEKFISKSINPKLNLDSLRINLNGEIIDTLVIHFGDVDEEIENVVYSSEHDRVTPIVKIDELGEVAFQIIASQQNQKAAQKNINEIKNEVDKILKSRKTIEETDKYLNSLFEKQKGRANRILFDKITDKLFSILIEDSLSHKSKNLIFITGKDIEEVAKHLSLDLNKPFIYFEKDSLSLVKFLDGIKYQQIVLPYVEITLLKNIFNANIKTFIEYELLYKEGRRNNIQFTKNVQHDVEMWIESDLAKQFAVQLCDSLSNIKTNNCNEILQKYIAELTKQYSVSINFEKLKNVRTTNHNMVTWRNLGFGGRVLGVPSVSPSYQWLEKWKNIQKITQ